MSIEPQPSDPPVPPHDPAEGYVLSEEDIYNQCGERAADLCHEFSNLSANQIFLYSTSYWGLMESYRSHFWRDVRELFLLSGFCWLTIWVCSLISQRMTDVVTGLWVIALLIPSLRGLKIGSPKSIHFPQATRDRLVFTKLADVFLVEYVAFFYIEAILQLAVMQVLLIWYTSNHLGIGDMSFGDAILLTLDTVSQSVSFGLFEQYHPRFTRFAENMPWVATTTFFLFKVCYAGYFVRFVVTIWTWRKYRVLFPRLPRYGDVEGFADWLRTVTSPTHAAMKQYFDEYVFFLLLREYLFGRYERVKFLADTFAPVLIANSVRCLFVEPSSGRLLFELRRGYVDDSNWAVVKPH